MVRSIRRWNEEPWVLQTVSSLADRICATTTLGEAKELEIKINRNDARPPNLGNWMIYMVHRVELNDPTLTELSFPRGFALPYSDEGEDRIVPKLCKALPSSLHMRSLTLRSCYLFGTEEARLLRDGLANSRLYHLDISSNSWKGSDVKIILEALRTNTSLVELVIGRQWGDGYKASTEFIEQQLVQAVKHNSTLRKVGMTFKNRPLNVQMLKALKRNAALTRLSRWKRTRQSRMRCPGWIPRRRDKATPWAILEEGEE